MWICNLIGWCVILLMIADRKQYNSRSIYQAKGCDKLQLPLHNGFESQVLSLAKPKGWDVLHRITHSTRLQYIKERFLLVLLALFFKATSCLTAQVKWLNCLHPLPTWVPELVWGKGCGARRKEGRREQDPSDELGQVSFCI